MVQQVRHHLGDQYEYHFYRTHDGTEMDLVLTRNNQPVLTAEIKYTLAPRLTKSMILAVDDLAAPKNFIITPGHERFPVHEKIEVIGLAGFIEEGRN